MPEQPAAGGPNESLHIADAAPRGYRILFELGRGGMGAAFLARAEGAHGFERLVVIKRIRPERVDARSVERFLREAKLAAAIHHANVVSAQSVGEDAEGPFIVLDYIDGASLEELLDRSLLRGQSMPVPIMLRVALDALAGLHAVHEARDAHGAPLNVLHRDVSLQNILVGRDGVARLLDFGIARSELGGNTTDQQYIVGKLPYLPPEYLRREALAASADVYGLGVTLWLALTGQDMWPDASEAQLLNHILNDGVPRLSLRMQVAPEIVELVARATASSRSERFSTAREMATAIEQLGRDRGWLSTHHEVAEWLEQLAGIDLSRRRERIALSASEKHARPTATTSSSKLQVPTRGPRPLAIVAALVVLAAAALAGLARSRREARPIELEAPTSAEMRPSTSEPRATPTVAESPTALATSGGSVAPISSAAGKPKVTGRVGKLPASPYADASSPTPGVRPPSQIAKKNPYRD
jgi:serine/threonine-protein kinase